MRSREAVEERTIYGFTENLNNRGENAMNLHQSIKKFLTSIKITLNNFKFISLVIFKTSPFYFFTLTLTTIIEALLPIFRIYIIKEIMNAIMEGIVNGDADYYKLIFWIVLEVLVEILYRTSSSLNMFTSSVASSIISKKMNNIIINKALQLDLCFFDTGDYYKKLHEAFTAVSGNWEGLIYMPFYFISSIIKIFALCGILITYRTWILLFVLIGAIPNSIFDIKSRKERHKLNTNQLPSVRKTNYLGNLLTGQYAAKEIRMFGLGTFFLDKFNDLFDKRVNEQKATLKKIYIKRVFSNLFSILAIAIPQVFVGIQAIGQVITVGEYQYYLNSMNSLSREISSLSQSLSNTYKQQMLNMLLSEFLKITPKINLCQGKDFICEEPPKIEFENVYFTYHGSKEYAIYNMSFVINPYEKIALTGLNGAGKTTIIKLLTRLYIPDKGRILINGENIDKYSAVSLYKYFGGVFQDSCKYAFTAGENISISDISRVKDVDSIKDAAKDARAHDVICKLKDKYDTYLTKQYENEGISDLSGGEWQRIFLARGLFKKAKVMVLDEPTASLDPEAESMIFKNFISMTQHCTAILVTHRLSSVRMVDKIFYIQKGELLECGSHDNLMKLNGCYARLFNMQSEGYTTYGGRKDDEINE